ncbi:MAG TPA: LLM class flavin-dependent oxidoreductase, partial [Acidimicrobiales bacterium]|nr:LLM class flavin-dependent oxidoreductase [Acidimicrobiales bacterium]
AAAGGGGPARVLAALGPRMLALAGERSLGAHPYFTTVEHTAEARRVLGPGPLLAPELAVVVERDAEEAHRLARDYTSLYLSLPNYAQNLRRLGFSEDDVTGAGSDRLVDAVLVVGDEEAVARRVAAHLAAGADHVCVQVVTGDFASFPLSEYRALSPALAEVAGR